MNSADPRPHGPSQPDRPLQPAQPDQAVPPAPPAPPAPPTQLAWLARPARPVRPHTGRRRNEAARDAILRATLELMRAGQVGDLTIDAIAEKAGVGRQTIYRWWPSKDAVMADAMTGLASEVVPARDSGVLAADLTDFLVDSFAALEDPGTVRALRQMASSAQHDEHAAAVLAEFTAQRRAALRAVLEHGRDQGELGPDADLDMLVDMAYGVLWYRLLVGHAPLDEDAARRLADRLTAAGADG